MANPLNKYEYTYPIYIDSYIGDVRKEKEKFTEQSNFSTFSGPELLARGGEIGQNFYSLRKNRLEIPNAYYRNGVFNSEALASFLENGHIFVHPGEYSILGDSRYLGYESYSILMTDKDTDNILSVPSHDQAFIDFITGHVYKRNTSLRVISTPKDQGSVNVIDNAKEFIGFDFDADIENILINNFIHKNNDGILKFKPSNPDWNSDDFYLLCEKIGTGADKLYDQVFNTKYFPISEAGSDDFNFSDGLTRLIVRKKETSPEGDETITIRNYKIFNSYQEAELYEYEDLPLGCYLDRQKGKFYFAKSGLHLGEDEYVFSTDGINSTSPFTILSIPEDSGPLFDDSGYIQITNDDIDFNQVHYHKISNSKIQISQTTDGFLPGVKIYSDKGLSAPDGEIYAFYTVVMGLQSRQGNAATPLVREEIKPWRWKNQKAIAVLSNDNLYPYKITLKASDIPLIRNTGNGLIYGPIHSGSEIALIEGMVTTELGEPVCDQQVTVYVEQGSGYLNGDWLTTNVTTNSEGKFYANYNPNVRRDNWIYFKDSDVSTYAGKSFLKVNPAYNLNEVSNLLFDGAVESVVYTIRKDDGSLGTIGKKYEVDAVTYEEYPVIANGYSQANQTIPSRYWYAPPYNSKGTVIFDFFAENEISQYIGGTVVLDASLSGESFPGTPEYYSVKISNILKYPEAWWNSDTEMYDSPTEDIRQNTYLVIYDVESEDVYSLLGKVRNMWFIAKEDTQYSPELLNGRKVIIAEQKPSNWKHPSIEDKLPVYGPIMTSSYDQISKQFTVSGGLPHSSSVDRNTLIAGYAIIPDVYPIVKAKTLGEDKHIYSNNVLFSVQLNNRDRGVVEDVLKTIKIPYGFRLVDTLSEASSTIGINTFLTVNFVPGSSPLSTKYPLISYLDSNGIIYLGQNNEATSYQSGSSSVDFTISLDETY